MQRQLEAPVRPRRGGGGAATHQPAGTRRPCPFAHRNCGDLQCPRSVVWAAEKRW